MDQTKFSDFNESEWQELLDKVRRGLKVSVNSSMVREGDVFVLLKENKKYLTHAIDMGAGYLVVDSDYEEKELEGIKERGVKVLHRPDAKKALGELVAAHFGTERQDFILIGITGTNGKTTTTYLIEHLLNSVGLKVGVIGTINYRWLDRVVDSKLTTPGCIELHSIISRMRQDGVDVVIMEVSSHGLAQDRVAGLKFDFAVFTNLTQDHLDYHKDMEDYFKAKAKLFNSYLKKRAVAIINYEDEYGTRLIKSLGNRVIGYGIKDCPVDGIECLRGEILQTSRGFQLVRSRYRDKEWRVSFSLIGKHNCLNLLAAEGIGIAMGLKPDAFLALENIKQIPGRLERVLNPFDFDIFIDYAHTPDGLERVLRAVKKMDFKRLIVVFGCGGDRDRSKRPLMGKVASKYSDLIVLTSDNPRSEDPEAIIEDIVPGLNSKVPVIFEVDRKKAIEKALSLMEKGDALIIAGKGHETYQEIKGKRYPFSDRGVVEEIINSWK